MGIIETIKEREISAVHLLPTKNRGLSKIGGLPNLPTALSWPMWEEKPLAFVCQIDIREISGSNSVLKTLKGGMLYFFYDCDQSTWGYDPNDRGSWRVLHSEAEIPDYPCEAPVGLDRQCIYEEKPVTFKEIVSRPSGERVGIDPASLSGEEHEEYFEFLIDPYADQPKHQVGGYPFVEQSDMMELEAQLASNGLFVGDSTGYNDPRAKELEIGAKEWILLLQIDSDDDIEMMWGDLGLIYFWIRESDLARGHFDDVWMVLQCG